MCKNLYIFLLNLKNKKIVELKKQKINLRLVRTWDLACVKPANHTTEPSSVFKWDWRYSLYILLSHIISWPNLRRLLASPPPFLASPLSSPRSLRLRAALPGVMARGKRATHARRQLRDAAGKFAVGRRRPRVLCAWRRDAARRRRPGVLRAWRWKQAVLLAVGRLPLRPGSVGAAVPEVFEGKP